MFYLLFGTGVRLQEVCDLNKSDIFSDRIIVTGKGLKKREIYPPPEAIESYLLYPERMDCEYLFNSKSGKMSYNYFRKRCSPVAMKTEVRFNPHMARHIYATALFRKGMSVFTF
ncbi:site-specific integrase [Oxyplasma meridianum]|uniref:Site-specific integrase n=1 Tax=Oxyplasma meridianum TaxID=3073602 RepID=A0AAX4NIH4_9ARCH